LPLLLQSQPPPLLRFAGSCTHGPWSDSPNWPTPQ